MLDDKQLTVEQIREWSQYWWSKYCNSQMVPEREIYLKIYQGYDELLKLRLKHIFVSRDDEMPDFENMTGEERKKNPIWQKMSPVERMYAAGLVTGLDGEKITYSEFKNGMSPEREEKIDKIRFERREKRKWLREFFKLNKKYGNTSNN